jgi:hypothetical protein
LASPEATLRLLLGLLRLLLLLLLRLLLLWLLLLRLWLLLRLLLSVGLRRQHSNGEQTHRQHQKKLTHAKPPWGRPAM